MPHQALDQFTADSLPPDEITALKELERRNRDLGANVFLEVLRTERAPFHHQAEVRTLLHLLDLQPSDRVLDAGAGVGRIAMHVAPKVSQLVCVDFSPASLEALETEAARMNIDNIVAQQGDLCALPDSLGLFDKIYSVEVVQSIPSAMQRRLAMSQMHRLLKPGGTFVISLHCWNRRNQNNGDREKEGFWGSGDRMLYGYLYSPEELGALLEETGFRDVRLHGMTILPGRLTRYLPASLAVVETWLSMVPALSGMGHYVVATGKK